MHKQNSQATILLLFTIFTANLYANNILKFKNIANIKGVRENILRGYGIVVGLQQSGDTKASIMSQRSLVKMMKNLGVNVEREEIVSGNFASVVLTAKLPAFARIGDKINVQVAASGDAKSLAGGTLIQSQLIGGDQKVYAIAQGAVVVGQAKGDGASVLTVATIPQGAIIEREFIPELAPNGFITLSLKNADFTTNYRMSQVINSKFRGFYAKSLDPATIQIEIPPYYKDQLISFISKLESLEVEVDRKAIVVINERTGTVVMGEDIKVMPISIAHGDLSIQVASASKDKKSNSMLNINGTTVGDIVKSLNVLGVKPKDLVGILQAIHAAGALHGDILFI